MNEQYLTAGQVVTTHGVRGEVKLIPSCDGAEFLKQFRRLYMDGQEMEIQSLRTHKDAALIKFKGIDSVESAMALRGKQFFFARADASLAPGQIFLDDLYGLPVYDTRKGCVIGKLEEILFLPAGEVWCVKGEAGECMIPQKGGFIDPVSPGDAQITVHTIEGMLPDED